MVFTLKLVGLHVASDLFNVGSAALHVALFFCNVGQDIGHLWLGWRTCGLMLV